LLTLPGHVGAEARSNDFVPRTELTHPCSRQLSRQVRKQLEKEVVRPASQAGLTVLPDGCPFDVSRDLWSYHERHKSRKRGSTSHWTCGICGKVFKSEHYLDLHMERSHMDLAPAGGACLADHCEMFDACQDQIKVKRRSNRAPANRRQCDNSTMLQARHVCEDAMSRCFPLSQRSSRTLNAKFSKELCRMLDCRLRAEQNREEHSDLTPVVVVFTLIVLVCFVAFSLTVCCVDYSDELFRFLLDTGFASTAFVKRMTRARESTRETLGMDRTKRI